MSLLLNCETCMTPIARLDATRFRVAPSASYCRACSPAVLLQAALTEA